MSSVLVAALAGYALGAFTVLVSMAIAGDGTREYPDPEDALGDDDA